MMSHISVVFILAFLFWTLISSKQLNNKLHPTAGGNQVCKIILNGLIIQTAQQGVGRTAVQ